MVDQNLWEGRWCSWHSVLPSARGVSPDEVPVKTLRAFSPRLSCQTVARRMRSRKGGSRAAAGRSSCVAAPLDRPPGTAFAALYRVGLAGPARTMISTTVARCHDRSRVVGIAIAIDWQCPQSLVLHLKCRPCGQRHRGEQVRVDTTDSAPDNVWRLMKYRTSSSTASSGATDRTRHAPRSRLQRRLPETSSPTIKMSRELQLTRRRTLPSGYCRPLMLRCCCFACAPRSGALLFLQVVVTFHSAIIATTEKPWRHQGAIKPSLVRLLRLCTLERRP